ncbi:MAG TPA: protease pro-enzyme activation domain-containing protein [Capsulimonadaceae bacterium]|nr:protease pro-enzyme activation domain-containing protein [Capsulimonadaceae bacterium]
MSKAGTARKHAVLAGLTIAFAWLMTLTMMTPANADPPGWLRLPGHIPPAARGAEAVGWMPEERPISLALVLTLRNEHDLDALLQRLYDPNDPEFGHYLTSDQFVQQFAPTPADYAAVASFARANGLTVTGTYQNRLVLDVTGPIGTVEHAFGVGIEHFRDAHGRDFFGPTDSPAVPAALAGRISAVVGLDNATVWHTNDVALDPALVGQATPYQVGTGPYGALSPSDIKKAYNLASTKLNGAGQTLAVFELDGYNSSDITGYANAFGLAKTALQNVLVDGVSGAASGGGSAEVTLDIELQMALAPAASKIMVYEGPNSGQGIIDTYNRIATDDAAKEISSSWGAAEQTGASSLWNSENAIFKQMAAQGQSFFASSGDSGAYDNGSSLSVDDPASQPYVVGVGGTHLSLSSGAYSKESTWNNGSASAGAGGGGVSKIWAIPSWQQGVVPSASHGSQTMRNVPDVSLDADPNTGYAIYLNGGWTIYGGTSCASPLWAAFTALVNQQRLAAGQGYLGFADPLLYQIGKSARYSSDFHDIADGSTNLYFPAVAGYDDATGWGSFNGAGMLADLAPVSTTISAPTGLTATASIGQISLSWSAVSGAASYNLYRGAASGQETLYKSGIAGTSYADTAVTAGQTYYYEVAAMGSSGTVSALSNQASAAVAGSVPAGTRVLAINVGGPATGAFAADSGYSGGTVGVSHQTVSTTGVANAAPMAVYQTQRFGNFSYRLAGLTAGGQYTVRLHFAETYFGPGMPGGGGTGSRKFNVSVNGAQAISNLDVYSAAGGSDKALVIPVTTKADSSGAITLQFTTLVNNAMVDGVEVVTG